MSTPAQIGGNNYNEVLEELRLASKELRQALQQLVDEPGPHNRATLLARAALALTRIEAAQAELDRIGRDTKKKR